VLLLVAALLAAAPSPANPAPSRYRWSAEASAGFEYDSNATRLDTDPASTAARVDGAAFRGAATLLGGVRLGQHLGMSAAYDLAGRVFLNAAARGQDALIHRLTTGVGVVLGPGISLRLTGLYHEGFQRESRPGVTGGALYDFRLLDGRLSLGLDLAPGLAATLAGGAHRFTFKPTEALGFDAATAGVTLDVHRAVGQGRRESELDLSASYLLALRYFEQAMELACAPDLPTCTPTLPDQIVTFPHPVIRRRDLLHRVGLDATWVKQVLLSVGYGFIASQSSSHGLGYHRHEVQLKLVAPLFLKIYGTVLLRARFLRYDQPDRPRSAVDPDALGFEEENRSMAVVQLEREVVRGLRVVLRYSLFVGDLLAPEVEALRHLLYLGVTYQRGSR
jgi:hypothetical protein